MPTKHIIIPARYNSSRLHGKLMLDLAGKPLIAHTIESAKSFMDSVIVATDHPEIFDCAVAYGARAIMTSDSHNSGTDRLAEVVNKLSFDNEDIVINLQGDEPLLPSQLLEQVSNLLEKHKDAGIATLIQPITQIKDLMNPNVVKVVMAEFEQAIYFSRAPIPYPRDFFTEEKNDMPKGDFYRHLGLYAYRVKTLKRLSELPEHPIEALEKLEQLRALANGIKIVAELASQSPPHGVDTIGDFKRIEKFVSSVKRVL